MSVVAVAGSSLAARSVRRRGGRRYRLAVHVATAWAALVVLLLVTLPAVASLFGSQQIDRAGVLQSSPLARLDLSATAPPHDWTVALVVIAGLVSLVIALAIESRRRLRTQLQPVASEIRPPLR